MYGQKCRGTPREVLHRGRCGRWRAGTNDLSPGGFSRRRFELVSAAVRRARSPRCHPTRPAVRDGEQPRSNRAFSPRSPGRRPSLRRSRVVARRRRCRSPSRGSGRSGPTARVTNRVRPCRRSEARAGQATLLLRSQRSCAQNPPTAPSPPQAAGRAGQVAARRRSRDLSNCDAANDHHGSTGEQSHGPRLYRRRTPKIPRCRRPNIPNPSVARSQRSWLITSSNGVSRAPY